MSCETQPQVRSWATSHYFVAWVVYLTPCVCFEGVASWPSLLPWGGADRTEGIREYWIGEEMKHNIRTPPALLCSQSSDCFLCAKTQYKTDTFRGIKTKEWVAQNAAERPTCKYQLHKNSRFSPAHSFGIVSRKEITIRNLCYPGVKLGSQYDLCVVFPPPSVAET